MRVKSSIISSLGVLLASNYIGCSDIARVENYPEGTECTVGQCSIDHECGFAATCWEKFADQDASPELAQCVSGNCVYSWPCVEGQESEQVAVVEGGINPATLTPNKDHVAVCKQFALIE